MQLKSNIIILMLLILVNTTFAQTKAIIELERDSILEGEQIKMTLKIPNSFEKKYLFPTLKDSIGKIELLEYSTIDTTKEWLTQIFVITNFDSGAYVIDPIKIISKDGTDSIFTNEILLKVGIFDVDTSKPFKPIFGIRTTPKPPLEWKKILLIILGILILAALIYYFYKKRKNKKPAEIIEYKSPYDRAKEALKEIGQNKEWEKDGNEKEYYVKITDILRRYFYEEYGVNALESTTNELMQSIKKVKKINKKRNELYIILERADLAKFAKTRPSIIENEESYKLTNEILKYLKPIETPKDNTSNEKK